jgi:hypothetical protein
VAATTMRRLRTNWTPEEDAQLKELAAARKPVEEIAETIGRTVPAVRSRGYIVRVKLYSRLALRYRGSCG